jgi:hypothetical protein
MQAINTSPLDSAWASVIKSGSNRNGADIPSMDISLETKAYIECGAACPV